jgi:uncharacterized protein
MSSFSYQNRLVIFVKAPVMGRCKTRLAKDIGGAKALGFYRHATKRLAHILGQDQRWQTALAIDPLPAIAAARTPFWPEGLLRISQGSGDLGARMGRVIKDTPPGPVVIIGSDAPQISPALIVWAFKELRNKDAVFGPATDGGYWLIGLRRQRSAPALFDGVRWSSQHALADTLASLPEDFTIGTLPLLSDVDSGEDYQQGLQHLRFVAPAP